MAASLVPSFRRTLITRAPTFAQSLTSDALFLPALSHSIFSRLPIISFTLSLPSLPSLPSLWESIWEGILRAVPKKKTTHSKSRSRRLGAGKHLKDLTSLNRCSACGRVKRMHVLCPWCVQSIKDMWAGRLTRKSGGDAGKTVGESKESKAGSS